jgi:hypothetical protein
MSVRSILNPVVSPSKVKMELQEEIVAELSDEQKELQKLNLVVERIKKIVTSPKKLLPRDIENISALVRQLKLHLTVNEKIRVEFAFSNSMNVFMSILKKCINWAGIISDLLLCLHMLITKNVPKNNTENETIDINVERYHELTEMMCRYGVIEVSIGFLKKYNNALDLTKLTCLELLLCICDYVTMRNSTSTAPYGRDVVYDGSAMVQSTVHLLVKNGALKLLPSILLENYRYFDGRGAECVVKLLLFIISSCSQLNAIEICKGIDKGFVSAAVVVVYKSMKNSNNNSESPPSMIPGLANNDITPVVPLYANVIILIAG